MSTLGSRNLAAPGNRTYCDQSNFHHLAHQLEIPKCNKMLLKISKFLLYVSVFSVVVVLSSTFFPFIGGKDYFFRVSVELALVFFALSWAFENPEDVKSRLKKVASKPIFKAVSVFVLLVILASLFAYDLHAAFWSNYERGEGGFQMIHYYIFFALLLALFTSDQDWSRLFKASLVAAVLMVLYGLFANLGWADNFIGPYSSGTAPASWWHKLVDGRFQGSLGNPAYAAPYLIFSMFYAFYLWAESRMSKLRRWIVYGGLTVAFLFFFTLSQTRGAFFGLGAAILAFLLYLIFRSCARVRKVSIIVLVCLVLLATPLFLFSNSPVVQKIPGSRMLDLSILSTDSFKTRLWTWGSAWGGFLERPILGWGPENFSTVFDKFFNPNHFVPGRQTETWFDRAHSVYFDYLTETGIFGLLSYLAIFTVFFWQFFKHSSKTEDLKVSVKNALVFSLPVGYLVQGLVIFDVLPMYINLFLFFAFSQYFFSRYVKHE